MGLELACNEGSCGDSISFAFEKTPRSSLSCKLVPVQYVYSLEEFYLRPVLQLHRRQWNQGRYFLVASCGPSSDGLVCTPLCSIWRNRIVQGHPKQRIFRHRQWLHFQNRIRIQTHWRYKRAVWTSTDVQQELWCAINIYLCGLILVVGDWLSHPAPLSSRCWCWNVYILKHRIFI